jgi:putative thioredoxin
MKPVDPPDFQRDVIERSMEIPVLVDFWAEWCAPCRALAPLLEKLTEKNEGRWALVKLNTGDHPDIASQYKVTSIPNVKLFVDGEILDEFTGALSEYRLSEWLKRTVPGLYEKEIDSAGNFILQGEPSKALALLEGVLHKEPGNLEAVSLLARLKLFSSPSEALRLCGMFADEPAYNDFAGTIAVIGRLLLLDMATLQDDPIRAAYVAAVDKLKKEEFDGALEGFIGVLREKRQYDEDGPRKACIAIFRFLGEDHPVSLKHRRSFDRAF